MMIVGSEKRKEHDTTKELILIGIELMNAENVNMRMVYFFSSFRRWGKMIQPIEVQINNKKKIFAISS